MKRQFIKQFFHWKQEHAAIPEIVTTLQIGLSSFQVWLFYKFAHPESIFR